MLSSFRTRLLVLLILFAVLVQIASAVASLSAIRQESVSQGQQALDVGFNVFSQTLSNRSQQLAASVNLLAADYGFKRAVATREQATMESVLDNHGRRINADAMILWDTHGQLLASSIAMTSDELTPLIEQLKTPRPAGEQPAPAQLAVVAGKPYMFVATPVQAPNTVAWIAMGFLLDQRLAASTYELTGLETSFIARSRDGTNYVASTLSNQQQHALLDLNTVQLARQDTSETVALANHEFMTRAKSLLHGEQPIWSVLMLPNSHWQERYADVKKTLLATFAMTLLVGLLAALWLARSLARPVQLLANYAQRIGSGETGPVPPVAFQELSVLSRSLQTMQAGIAEREKRLLLQSQQDLLTQLANRDALESVLAHHCVGCEGSLVQINIKNFRRINDSMGYNTGDAVLQQLADRLRHYESTYSVGRIGGDEFLLISQRRVSDKTVQAILDTLLQPITVAGMNFTPSLALGILHFGVDDGSVNERLRRVDIAVNSAKRTRQTIAVYQAGQDETHQRELQIIHDLVPALGRGELHLVYQPKVRFSDRSPAYAEALLRWNHPELGFINPEEFIRLAETSGNIQAVTRWVLEQVARQVNVWRAAGIGLTVAVNASVHDLMAASFPEELQQLLVDHKLHTTDITLEVTESAMMDDPDKVISSIAKLRGLGFHLSIDDFGTGQSSMMYLQKLSVQELKIDKSFVMNMASKPEDKIIVATVIGLAHSLNLSVVAEGVEDIGSWNYLSELGCDYAQGYFLARPLAADKLPQWLEDFRQSPEQWFPAE